MRYFRLAFIILIFSLLVLPLTNIDKSSSSQQENRTLAKFPKLINDGKTNYNFGKNFEQWLDDHFWGRKELIDARFELMNKVNGKIENEYAFVGQDGWMFEKKDIFNIPSLQKQQEQILHAVDTLKKLADKLKDNNVPIYIVFLPTRTQVYQRYWEKYYTPRLQLDYVNEIKEHLQEYPNIHIIDLTEEILNASFKEEIAYKEDIHFNLTGANIVRKRLYEELKKDFFPDFDLQWKIVPGYRNERQRVRAFLGLKLQDKLAEDFFVDKILFEPAYQYSVMQHDIQQLYWPRIEKTSSSQAMINKNLVVEGFCFAQGINRLFAPIFKNTYYFRLYDSDMNKKYMIFNRAFMLKLLSEDSVLVLFENAPQFKEIERLDKLLADYDKLSKEDVCPLVFKHKYWIDCMQIDGDKLRRLENKDIATYDKEGNVYTVRWEKYTQQEIFVCDAENMCVLEEDKN